VTVLIGQGGFSGWRLLQRTAGKQLQMLARDPQVGRERDRFAQAAGRHASAEAIVGDYQTLKVALTAFGLEADLPNKAFIRKILESELSDPKSLANRLSDKRYRKFAEAFGLGPGAERPKPETLAAHVNALFLEREFERQVGEADPNLRLALNAKRELALLANRNTTDRTKWFEVLGTPPLRSVLEGALGLSKDSARMPVDAQAEMFREAAERRFGAGFFARLDDDPQLLGKVIESFLARASALASRPRGPYSAALVILGAGRA